MADNTTASLEKLTSTKYANIGKRQNGFWRLFWFANDSEYLNKKLNFFKRGDKKYTEWYKILQ